MQAKGKIVAMRISLDNAAAFIVVQDEDQVDTLVFMPPDLSLANFEKLEIDNNVEVSGKKMITKTGEDALRAQIIK